MSGNKEIWENQKVIHIVNLIKSNNMINADLSEKNDILSSQLELFITNLRQGAINKVQFVHLLNRAMDYTRSDPYISEEYKDELLSRARDVPKLLLLPSSPEKKVRAMIACLRLFQEALLGSQRRAFNHNQRQYDVLSQELIKNYGVIDPVSVPKYPGRLFGRKSKSKEKKYVISKD